MFIQYFRTTNRFSAVLFALGLISCSPKGKGPEPYTLTANTSALESPILMNIRGVEGFQITPPTYRPKEYTTKLRTSKLSAEDITIAEQPEDQSCYLYRPRIDDENRTVSLSFECQSYQYGPSGVTDFAVARNRTCAAFESRVECWGENIEAGNIDFEMEYQNPRLLTMGASGRFCFLDDNGLYCSNDGSIESLDFFDPTTVYQNALNIREMKLGSVSLCYIDDNGLSCVGESLFDANSASDLVGPHNLVGSPVSGGCVLDADGKIHCWGWLGDGVDLNASGRVYEKLGAHYFNVCGYGSDGTFCIIDPFRFTRPEFQEDIGVVTNFVMGELNSCAVTTSQNVCWDDSFPEDTEVFRNILSSPSKIEYASGFGKGCALEGDRLICFGDPNEIDFNKNDDDDFFSTLPIPIEQE